MRCITFTSDDLDTYPADTAGAHLKIFLPLEGQTKPTVPSFLKKALNGLKVNQGRLSALIVFEPFAQSRKS